MTEPFLSRLDREVLVGDGAMGTELYAKGIDLAGCFDALNLDHPSLVAEVHRAYAEAGSDLLETNTFGATRPRLAAFGLEDKVAEINRAGAKLARKEAGSRAYVAGSIGPVGDQWGTEEGPTPEQVREAFREQVKALADGGVDVLLFETFSHLNHLLEGLRVAREETKLPVVCQMSFMEEGRTLTGIPAVACAKALEEAGADVVGANCVSGPIRTLESVEMLARACRSRLSAFPNAGAPTFVNGRYIYAATTEYLAEYALRMVEAGVSLVGGCCGTSPAHIRAIVERLQGRRAVRARPAPVSFPIEVREPAASAAGGPSIPAGQAPDIVQRTRHRKLVTVELDPPKGTGYQKALASAKALAKEGGVDLFNLAENTMGIARMSNIVLGHILQQETGIEALTHVTCRDRNLVGLQSAILGAWALGIRHILAITGDPASIGAQPGASSVYDTQSFGLISLIRKLNSGVGSAGNPIGTPTGFSIGVAFDPFGARLEPYLNRLKKKIALGAHYALTQPAFDAERSVEMYRKAKELPIPVYLGVMPLAGERNAEYLHNEVPGIRIPSEVRAQMKGLKGAEGKARGLALAKELVERVFPLADGFYIIPVFNDLETALEMVRHIRTLSRKAEGAPAAK